MSQTLILEMEDDVDAGTVTRVMDGIAANAGAIDHVRIEIRSGDGIDIGLGTPGVDADRGAGPSGGTRPGNGDEDLPPLREGSNQHTIAAVLADHGDPLTSPAVVAMSEGTDWEMNESQVSSALYSLFEKGIVDREREAGAPYEYAVTATGRRALAGGD